MQQHKSTLAPLRNPVFRSLWLALLVSNLGGLIQVVGVGWTMTLMTDSNSMIALVQAASTLPVMMFSMMAGVLADNLDRRHVLLWAQALMMAASFGLAALTLLDGLSPWILLGFTFLIGCGNALNNPSWQASVGDIVTRDEVPQAVSLNSVGFNLMRSVGPALGGMIVAVAGVFTAFALNALSYLPLIWAIWRWKPKREPRTLPRERFGGAMRAGIRYVLLSPRLLTVMLRAFVFSYIGIAVMALMPSVASQYVAAGALGYGTLLGAFGLGAIGAALMNQRLRALLSNEGIIRLACAALGVGAIVLGLSRNSLLSHLAMLPAGAAWVLALSLFNVSVQFSSPRWVVGRALSIYQTCTFGGMALGSWFHGWSADLLGLDVALVGAGGALLASLALGLVLPLLPTDAATLDPTGNVTPPPPKLDIRPQSGPILVTVDYLIDDPDIPAFMAVMAERRRIRLRNGASNWVLLRDLSDPHLWSESYHVATWTDYIRMMQRRTQADAENHRQLLLLHRGDGPPVAHRKLERHTVRPPDHGHGHEMPRTPEIP